MSWRNAYRVGQRLIVGTGLVTVLSTKDNIYPLIYDIVPSKSISSWRQVLSVRAEETEAVVEVPVAEIVPEVKEAEAVVDDNVVDTPAAIPPTADIPAPDPSVADPPVTEPPVAEPLIADSPLAESTPADPPAVEPATEDLPTVDPPAVEITAVSPPESEQPPPVLPIATSPVPPTILGQSYTTVATVTLASLLILLIALKRN